MAKRSSKKDKKIITVVVICAAVLIALITRISDGTWDKLYKDSGVNSPPAVSGDVSVHFVDVGQGDCTVIYSKEYGVTVIDTGEADKAQTVINYLRSLGVDKINYCIDSPSLGSYGQHGGGFVRISRRQAHNAEAQRNKHTHNQNL